MSYVFANRVMQTSLSYRTMPERRRLQDGRIVTFKPVRKDFIRVDFDADSFFKDIIGVTRY